MTHRPNQSPSSRVSFSPHSAWCLALFLSAMLPCFGQPGTIPAGPDLHLTLNDAVSLALGRASTYGAALLNQSIAGEDVRQSKAAFLPRTGIPTTFTYNSPERGAALGSGAPFAQSFISLNSIREYQSFLSVTGEVDVNGRLSATLRRNRDLLMAARAGTEVARRDLVIATQEAYYGAALATARLTFAERNLATAREFERVTDLLAKSGEVPAIDLSRARLQTATRLDEQAQAKAGVVIAIESLRFLIGADLNAQISVENLEKLEPVPGELDILSATAPAIRPEVQQIEAQRRAAEEEARIARAERRPSILYSLNAGTDTGSLQGASLNRHSGASAIISLNIPIFDWGASRSRERQAEYRAQVLGVQRTLFARGVIQQMATARGLAETASERLKITGAAITDAQRNASTSLARYRAGEAPILEVTDAQNILTVQQQAFYQAIFDYRVGIARLEYAAGITK